MRLQPSHQWCYRENCHYYGLQIGEKEEEAKKREEEWEAGLSRRSSENENVPCMFEGV